MSPLTDITVVMAIFYQKETKKSLITGYKVGFKIQSPLVIPCCYAFLPIAAGNDKRQHYSKASYKGRVI